MGMRKAKLLRNMALKEQARLPHFVQRQQALQVEIDQIQALLERMETLRDYARDQTVQQAHKLHTNRYYELRLIEETQALSNKLDFLTVELTNVTDEPVYTGNRTKYNIQAYTEDGWQDVRVADEEQRFGYEDDAVEHPPGEGFEWPVELTEAGIVAGTHHAHAEVCPELSSGRYRFAFFGITDGAVAVAFDLRR